MTVQVDSQTTVRDLVGRYPQTRQVFEKFEIDYCCGGAKSLADVAADQDLNVSTLVETLTETLETDPSVAETAGKDWYAGSLSELIEHILATHHAFVKEALPRLRPLIAKVLAAHGEHHGDMLRQVQTYFNSLDNELTSHMMKEEQMLFPYIVALDRHSREGTARPQAPFGSVRNPVRQMEFEHENAGDALAGLRHVTGGYTLPDDACPTFQAMYDELERFEADLHQHIHLENNILFPRAIEMEAA